MKHTSIRVYGLNGGSMRIVREKLTRNQANATVCMSLDRGRTDCQSIFFRLSISSPQRSSGSSQRTPKLLWFKRWRHLTHLPTPLPLQMECWLRSTPIYGLPGSIPDQIIEVRSGANSYSSPLDSSELLVSNYGCKNWLTNSSCKHLIMLLAYFWKNGTIPEFTT